MKKSAVAVCAMLLALSCLSACAAKPGAEKDADLGAFYETLAEEYELPGMTDVDGDDLDGYYPGLGEIPLRQCVAKVPLISAVVYEFVFIECENEADVSAAAEILQARVDGQASGGAWYPASMEAWGRARVLTNGRYVAMIAADVDTEGIAAKWDALFA